MANAVMWRSVLNEGQNDTKRSCTGAVRSKDQDQDCFVVFLVMYTRAIPAEVP